MKTVLQIEFSSGVLGDREAILRRSGCRVLSLLGSDEAEAFDPVAHNVGLVVGDVPSFAPQVEPTIAEVLDDLYEVRNCIAHGDKVPDKFFNQTYTAHGNPNRIATLEEAASFIVRGSLLKILKENLLQHFKGGVESQAYFKAHGLVRSQLP